ncbi:MAG: glycine--tRNA ligase subunit beta [Candidatus Omnitrophica bacterium]|nr:glycine--tRNA ligase subunit beta [Candidatus Omnitrophota bacterium]
MKRYGKTSKESRAPRPLPRAPASAEMLFEIGTEELPAAYVPGLIEQLGRETAALLQSRHLTCERVLSYGTPRRLVVIVRGLATTQHNPAEEIRGPSKRAAYDKEGKPTPALQGFLRSQGGTAADIKVVSSEKGDYLYFTKRATTVPTATVLPGLLLQLIAKLRSPKSMRWDSSGVRFARPIRWLLALYDGKPLRCTFGTLTSAARTWVGGPLHPRSVKVISVGGYLKSLTHAGVIVNQEERRAAIDKVVTQIASRARGKPAIETASHGLLEEVTYLVESPAPLTGVFDQKYLALPREVLLASMAKHQRVFAIQSSSHALLPQCVAILEGTPTKPDGIRKTVERILNARLADSLMFWNDDHTRLPLEQMATALSGVTFHEQLGSMADKTQRLVALIPPLADAWQLTGEERHQLERACRLAKADLVSTMVKEFPTLQGIMGKHYAKDSGESQAVADAIEEHYLPLADRAPKTLIGSALAILDKWDTLTSYFGVGIMPTGDQDPFGLRRAAQGIVEVAWAIHRPLPIDALLEARFTLPPFAGKDSNGMRQAGDRIRQYLLERLYMFAWPPPAPSTDCIDAVLSSPCRDLIDVMDRVRSLHQMLGHPDLLKAAKVIERTRNILKGATLRQPEVDPARLQEAPERALWDLYRSNEARVIELTNKKSYADATTLFGAVFFEPLHEFFDRVLVNVKEEALQQNRLALMRAIHTLYTDRIADLSKLTIVQQQQESAR